VTGVFLIFPGFTYLGAAVAPRPGATRHKLWAFFTTDSWLLRGLRPRAMCSVGIALFVLATVGFVLAGLAEFIGLGVWRVLAVFSALDSLVLVVLFWHPYLPRRRCTWAGNPSALARARMYSVLAPARQTRPDAVPGPQS